MQPDTLAHSLQKLYVSNAIIACLTFMKLSGEGIRKRMVAFATLRPDQIRGSGCGKKYFYWTDGDPGKSRILGASAELSK